MKDWWQDSHIVTTYNLKENAAAAPSHKSPDKEEQMQGQS